MLLLSAPAPPHLLYHVKQPFCFSYSVSPGEPWLETTPTPGFRLGNGGWLPVNRIGCSERKQVCDPGLCRSGARCPQSSKTALSAIWKQMKPLTSLCNISDMNQLMLLWEESSFFPCFPVTLPHLRKSMYWWAQAHACPCKHTHTHTLCC